MSVDAERGVVVTTGGQEAIFLLVQALLEPGDEILMPDPRYTAYDVAVNVAGARIVAVPPPEPAPGEAVTFVLDADVIAARITPRTKAILIIAPGNPTGAVPTRAELEAVARVAEEHDLIVISDEMSSASPTTTSSTRASRRSPGAAARTVTVGGFSKTYAMTGWRLGYAAGPASIVEEVVARKAQVSGCAPVVSQLAGLAALEGPAEPVAAMHETYAARRRTTLEALERWGIPVSPSQAPSTPSSTPAPGACHRSSSVARCSSRQACSSTRAAASASAGATTCASPGSSPRTVCAKRCNASSAGPPAVRPLHRRFLNTLTTDSRTTMFEGLLSPTHLIIVLAIALIVLGPKKLPEAGRGLGAGIREFRSSITGKSAEPAEPAAEIE